MDLKSLKLGDAIEVHADANSDLTTILPYLTPKYQAELKALFPTIEQGLADGVISSKFVTRLETLVSKCTDYARALINKTYKKAGIKDIRDVPNFGYKEKFYDVGYVLTGSVYDVATHPEVFIKEYEGIVDTLTHEYPEFGKALATLIKMAKDFLPISALIKKLTSIETNKTIEKYRPPQAKVKTMQTLYDVLDKFMAATRNEMIAFWEKSLIAGATKIVSIYADKAVSYRDYKNIPAAYMNLIDTDHESINGNLSNFRLKKDATELAKLDAIKIADSIKGGFLAKSVHKLANIIENRGDYEATEKQGLSFHNGAIEGRILVKFQNGDSFVCFVQIVSVVNQQGTAFTRYPLTFKNVKLGDRTFNAVTEEWMNKNFNKGEK